MRNPIFWVSACVSLKNAYSFTTSARFIVLVVSDKVHVGRGNGEKDKEQEAMQRNQEKRKRTRMRRQQAKDKSSKNVSVSFVLYTVVRNDF